MSMVLVCVCLVGMEMTVVQVVMTQLYDSAMILFCNTDCITCRIMCQL